MRFWLSLLVTVLLSAVFPLRASAQSPVVFDKVQVSIMPEYDQPSVLVMYDLSISSGTSLPAQVSFRIPKVVGKPSAVAMRDVDGTLVNLNYTTADDGDWLRINFFAPAQLLRIEYYDNRLAKNGPARSFEYRWPGDYAVNSLTVQVQQPVNATNMQITPSLGSGQQQQDGLTYYEKNIGEVKAGTPFTLRLSYNKKDDALSISSSPVESAGSIDANTPGRLTFQEVLPWALGGLGLLLVAGGVVWYWYSSRDRRGPAGAAGRRHRAAAAPARQGRGRETETSTSTREAIYCHQCGRRANAGDVFCRTCGTKLRL